MQAGWLGWICATALFGSDRAADDAAPVSEAARPYRVALFLAHDVAPALPASSMRDLAVDLSTAAARLLGECWRLEIRLSPNLAGLPDPAFAETKEGPPDKLLLVRLDARPGPDPPTAVVREFDALMGEWGPPCTAALRRDPELPMQVLRLCLRAFRPTAEIVGKEKGRARLSVRGAARIPQTSDVVLLGRREPLKILRIAADKPNEPEVVPWSYLVLRAESDSARRFSVEADVVSLFRDPLTRRSRTPIRLAAIACRIGDETTTLVEFRTRPDDRPIVGYEVAARVLGQAGFASLGSTDYSGRIAVSAPTSSGRASRDARVVEVHLRSGDLVLARFPMVPGDRPLLVAQTSIDPLLPETAGRVVAFQESLVDLAAQRKLLELRYQRAAADSNLPRMKEIVERLNALPDREEARRRLAELEESAKARSLELGQRSLGLNLRRLFAQSQALVERSVPDGKYQIQAAEDAPPATGAGGAP
jgi:hypothetical protein